MGAALNTSFAKIRWRKRKTQNFFQIALIWILEELEGPKLAQRSTTSYATTGSKKNHFGSKSKAQRNI